MIKTFLIAKLGAIEDVEVPPKSEIKPCLAACETQLYSLLITNANYPSDVTYKQTKGFCIVVKKLIQSLKNRKKSLAESQPKLIELLEELKVNSIYCYQKSRGPYALWPINCNSDKSQVFLLVN